MNAIQLQLAQHQQLQVAQPRLAAHRGESLLATPASKWEDLIVALMMARWLLLMERSAARHVQIMISTIPMKLLVVTLVLVVGLDLADIVTLQRNLSALVRVALGIAERPVTMLQTVMALLVLLPQPQPQLLRQHLLLQQLLRQPLRQRLLPQPQKTLDIQQ